MCELTYQSRLGIWKGAGLIEIGAKADGEYRAAALDSMRKRMCVVSIKACKPVPVFLEKGVLCKIIVKCIYCLFLCKIHNNECKNVMESSETDHINLMLPTY